MQCLTYPSYSIHRKCCDFIENTAGKTLADGLEEEKVGAFSLGCAYKEKRKV